MLITFGTILVASNEEWHALLVANKDTFWGSERNSF
jgi:hypothetical protein